MIWTYDGPELEQKPNPQLIAAIERMNAHAPDAEFLREIALSIPPVVPEVEKSGWNHGSCRVSGRIGGHSHWDIEQNFAPLDIDLSKIDYVAFYRQAVANKYTGDLKGFCVTIPLDFSGEVVEGQTIPVTKSIPFEYTKEDLEAMARESFLKLQEMVQEWHNREANVGGGQ